METLIAFVKAFTDFIPRITTIQPWEGGIRTTLGKHMKTVGPGWWFYWPVIHEIHYMEVQPGTADLRVQSVWTSDGKDLAISGGIKYRINDIAKAYTNIQEVERAIQDVALGTICEFVNARPVAECHDIKSLKGEILKGLRQEATGWGVKVLQVYVTDIGRARNIRLLHHNEATDESD